MVRTAVAFCPGHISGSFRRIEGESAALTGSAGAGIVISEGVRATAREADALQVRVRRVARDGSVIAEESHSPPLEYVLSRMGAEAEVTTECRLPIGAGFGLSAAALLSSITAASALLALGLSRHQIASLAHEAEIVHRTGLGDVAACQGGGMVCRLGPGIDAEIRRTQARGTVIAAVSTGPLATPEVLGNDVLMARIAAAFPPGCPGNVPSFFRDSRAFAENSGIIPPAVAKILDACDSFGIPASMTMLGEGVFACGKNAAGILEEFGEVWEMSVSREGFRLLEVRE